MKGNMRSAKRWCVAISIALPIFLSAGCGRRVVYVSGGHKIVKLKKGQPAPARGVWMSEEYLSEIHEALGREGQRGK